MEDSMLEGYSVEQEPISGDRFGPFVKQILSEAQNKLQTEGELDSHVIVLRDNFMYVLNNVPEGVHDYFHYMENLANHFKGADGYVILYPSWIVDPFSASGEDLEDKIDEVMQTPFKDEAISFMARGFDQTYSGRIQFERDDKGEIVVGETLFTDEAEYGDTHSVLDVMLEDAVI